jgi:hypothetical protein
VQDAAQIAIRDELRKFALERALDLAAALAQFRLDERQAKRPVDVFLLATRHAAALVKPVCLQSHALAFRKTAKVVKVRRRPRRLEEHRTEMVAVRQKHLQARGIRDRRAGVGWRSLGHER